MHAAVSASTRLCCAEVVLRDQGVTGIMRKQLKALLVLAVMVFVFTMPAYAKNYTKEGTFVWKQRDGLFYAYDAETGELIRSQKVGKCYVDENGTRYLSQFVEGIYYNANGIAKPKFKTGWVQLNGRYYYYRNRVLLTGYRKIGGKRYYLDQDGARLSGLYCVKGKYRFFKKNGVQVTGRGWARIRGKKYYLGKNGVINEGFFKVNGKKYYQTALTGILTGVQEINGKTYYFSAKGVYNKKKTNQMRTNSGMGPYSDILFFTKFESGNAGYAQTGGDHGHACGKYQFDYRYSLVPFLNYCYNANPTFFKGFKNFIGIKAGSSSLVNNKKLYAAWAACYKADPNYFSTMQDNYALEAYYKPAENYLAKRGIHLELRPYVIRGAVFSYAIQEGSTVAAQGVIAAGLTDNTSNQKFLTKLYDYRWKDPRGWQQLSMFKFRYTQEKALALEYLARIS